jgi:protein-S-isoprenylcysteine O-methyltransferase Ste14
MDIKWIITLLFAFLYGLFEFYMNVRLKKSNKVVKSGDKGSLKVLYLFIQIGWMLSFGIALTLFGRIDLMNVFVPLGVVLITMGLYVRITSINTLKNHYTYSVSKIENHELIKSGLYKYIRHPGYLGLFIVFLGISTVLSNWLSILFMAVSILAGIINRIRIEERFLIEHFGEEYITYQKQVKRLIPYIY